MTRALRLGARPGVILGAALLASMLGEGNLRADPGVPVSDVLTVEGGGECLATKAVVEQVASWLGRGEVDPRIRILVKARGEPPDAVAFSVRIEGRERAERHFRKPPSDCADVRAAVALAIALSIDGTILESLGIAEPPAAVEPVGGGPDVEVALSVLGLFGAVADASLGFEMDSGFSFGPLVGARLGLLATTPAESDLAGGSVETWVLGGRGQGCLRRAFGSVDGAACGGVVLGTVQGEGIGFSTPQSTRVLWAAAAVGVDGTIRLGQGLGLRLGLDGFVPFVQPRFQVQGPRNDVIAEKSLSRASFGGRGGIVIAF